MKEVESELKAKNNGVLFDQPKSLLEQIQELLNSSKNNEN